MGLINWSPSHKHRSLRPPAAAPPKPRGDFLQLTSMTIFFYRRAAEARATIWRRSRRHLLAIGTKKSRKKKGESQDIRWHSQALNPLCMFAVTTAGDWRWLSHISSQPKPNVQFRGVGTFLAGRAFDHYFFCKIKTKTINLTSIFYLLSCVVFDRPIFYKQR